jgi:hypothetical protein
MGGRSADSLTSLSEKTLGTWNATNNRATSAALWRELADLRFLETINN